MFSGNDFPKKSTRGELVLSRLSNIAASITKHGATPCNMNNMCAIFEKSACMVPYALLVFIP